MCLTFSGKCLYPTSLLEYRSCQGSKKNLCQGRNSEMFQRATKYLDP